MCSMGLGVLEPRGASHVAGTVRLLDSDDTLHPTRKHVILQPTPSESPNDPLNWPLWKKNLTTFSLSLGVGLGGILSGIFSVSTAAIAEDYRISILKAERFSSYPFLACGCACLASSILSRVFGKRPVFLVSAALELASCIWSACANGYGSQIGARIFCGLGVGAFESIVLATIGDMYFVHERGRPTAFYSAMGLGCIQLSPVLGGYVTEKYGWRTQFWIMTAFWAVAFLLIVFCLPETSYRRSTQYETDVLGELEGSSPHSSSIDDDPKNLAKSSSTTTPASLTAVAEDMKPKSYLAQLSPVSHFDKRANPVKLTVRLFLCALYPAVWLAFLASGVFVGWFSAIAVTLAQIFTAPPLLFTPTKLGFLNSLCFPGALVAFIMTHLLSDRVVHLMARRNRGIFEPEFRLVLMVLAFVPGVIGFALFAWYTGTVAIDERKAIEWTVTSLIYGIIIFSVVASQSIAYSYLLDSHRDISIETGVFTVMLRNFFSYGSTTAVPIWLENQGVANTFYAIAGIQGGIIALPCIIMYIWGKKIRFILQRYSPMTALHVDAIVKR